MILVVVVVVVVVVIVAVDEEKEPVLLSRNPEFFSILNSILFRGVEEKSRIHISGLRPRGRIHIPVSGKSAPKPVPSAHRPTGLNNSVLPLQPARARVRIKSTMEKT